MGTLRDRLAAARHAFERAGIAPDEAAIDADVLARHALGWDRATLITHGPEPPPAGFDEAFSPLVERRLEREPVALIVGHREFWGLEFEVTRDVLVPRPETELVVEAALEFAAAGDVRRIVDAGTGSGCIAVSLAVSLPGVRVTATDTSAGALAVARRNARRHGVEDRIAFIEGDLIAGVKDPADLIVSNPPYVPAGDLVSLPPEVARYEPHQALLAGDDGLSAIGRLLEEGRQHLAPAGRLVVEFGFGQASRVTALAAAAGWRLHSMRHDLQQIPRVIVLGRETR
jgi:release factor glutamine methyltransferase